MQLAPIMQLRRERAEEKYVGGTATGHAHESGERNKWAQHAPTNTIRASILNMRPCGCSGYAPALSILRGPYTRHTAQAASTSRAIPSIKTTIEPRPQCVTQLVVSSGGGPSEAFRLAVYAARARLAGGFSCTAVLILKAASMACASRISR